MPHLEPLKTPTRPSPTIPSSRRKPVASRLASKEEGEKEGHSSTFEKKHNNKRKLPFTSSITICVEPEALRAPLFSSSRRKSVPVVLEEGESPRMQPVLQSIATGRFYLFIKTLVHEKARVMIMLAAVLEPLKPSTFLSYDEMVWIPGQRVVVKVTDRRMVDHKPRESLIENPFDEVSAMQIMSSPTTEAEKEEELQQHQRHPIPPHQSHCLGLLDAMEDEDYLYCIMPYLPGRDLYQKLEVLGVGLPEKKAVVIFEQIVQGLRQMKKYRLAHRDISLENIMFDEEAKVKIIDFGMCVRVPETTPFPTTLAEEMLLPRHHRHHPIATMTKITKQAKRGKALYVSPEVYHEVEYDPFASDIWSLGIVLYILLTNRPLYSGPDDQAYRLICDGRLGDLFDHYLCMGIFNVSWEARNLLMSMLCPQPEERITLEDILDHPWMVMRMRSAGGVGSSSSSAAAAVGGCMSLASVLSSSTSSVISTCSFSSMTSSASTMSAASVRGGGEEEGEEGCGSGGAIGREWIEMALEEEEEEREVASIGVTPVAAAAAAAAAAEEAVVVACDEGEEEAEGPRSSSPSSFKMLPHRAWRREGEEGCSVSSYQPTQQPSQHQRPHLHHHHLQQGASSCLSHPRSSSPPPTHPQLYPSSSASHHILPPLSTISPHQQYQQQLQEAAASKSNRWDSPSAIYRLQDPSRRHSPLRLQPLPTSPSSSNTNHHHQHLRQSVFNNNTAIPPAAASLLMEENKGSGSNGHNINNEVCRPSATSAAAAASLAGAGAGAAAAAAAPTPTPPVVIGGANTSKPTVFLIESN